jgi:hypothetical protein
VDETCVTAVARATRKEAMANHSLIVNCIAQLEDSIEEEEATLHMHSIRPDLLQPR